MLNPETQPNSLQRSNPLVLPTSYIQALAVTIMQPLMSSPILLLKRGKVFGPWEDKTCCQSRMRLLWAVRTAKVCNQQSFSVLVVLNITKSQGVRMISTWQEDLLSCSQGAQPERGEHSDKKIETKNETKTLQPASLLMYI